MMKTISIPRSSIPRRLGTSLAVLAALAVIGCGGGEKPAAAPPPPPPPAPPPPPPPPPPAAEAPPPELPVVPAGTPEVDLDCLRRARDVPGAAGSAVLVTCPGDCRPSAGRVWGTDVYTDDSDVCPSLVHAGVVAISGGRALVTFADGQRAYVGSARNGVESRSYGKWKRSFLAQAVDAAGRITTAAPTVTDQTTARLDCSHRGTTFDEEPGFTVTITCPAGCTTGGSVWGTDTYTVDSSICAAAIHSGAIAAAGGSAKLTVTPGLPQYEGLKRYEVTSSRYGSYRKSFTVTR